MPAIGSGSAGLPKEEYTATEANVSYDASATAL